MSSTQVQTNTAPEAHELTLTRLIDAPRRMVFRAWTDPEQMARWCVLDGMSVVHETVEMRPGGAWLMRARHPNGMPITINRAFREIVPLSRIVFYEKCVVGDRVALDGVHTVIFEEAEGKTRLTVHVSLAQAFDAENQGGWSGGWGQIFDHLSAHLAATYPAIAAREIATTRLFDAPRELVFRTWTEPQHLARWWGPNGFTTTTHKMDMRTGGEWDFLMHGPDGTDYPNYIYYDEVSPPERLVYTHRGAKAGDDPHEFRVAVYFLEEGGKTRVDMQLLFGSVAHRNEVVEKHGAAEGLQQTLSRLEKYLPEIQQPARH